VYIVQKYARRNDINEYVTITIRSRAVTHRWYRTQTGRGNRPREMPGSRAGLQSYTWSVYDLCQCQSPWLTHTHTQTHRRLWQLS